jgi:hypothetical protein
LFLADVAFVFGVWSTGYRSQFVQLA